MIVRGGGPKMKYSVWRLAERLKLSNQLIIVFTPLFVDCVAAVIKLDEVIPGCHSNYILTPLAQTFGKPCPDPRFIDEEKPAQLFVRGDAFSGGDFRRGPSP